MEPGKDQQQNTPPAQPDTQAPSSEPPQPKSDTIQQGQNIAAPTTEPQPVAMDVVPPKQVPVSSDNVSGDANNITAATAGDGANSDSGPSVAADEKALPKKEPSHQKKTKAPKQDKSPNNKPIGFIIAAIVVALVVSGLLIMSYLEQGESPVDDNGTDAGAQQEPVIQEDEAAPEPINNQPIDDSDADLPIDDDLQDDPLPIDDDLQDDQLPIDDDVVDLDTPTSNE